MTVFCDQGDVEARLRRELTTAEETYLDDLIAEAQVLVIAYLNLGPEPYATDEDVPEAVTIVTSRMVARVIQQDGQVIGVESQNAGPFATKYVAGANTGSPWLAKADKVALRPHAVRMETATFVSERGYPDCDDDELGDES